jgi:hypothetical protein
MYGNEVLFSLWIVNALEVVVTVVHVRLWNFEGGKEDVMDLDGGTVLRRKEESMVYGNPRWLWYNRFVVFTRFRCHSVPLFEILGTVTVHVHITK